MKDPELRSVSSGARGLWIDMLSLMFDCVRRGYLQLHNGNVVTAELLARMTGNSTDDTSRWLQELEYSGVLSRTDDGIIYNRRQVREQTERSKNGDRVTKHRKKQDVTPDVTGCVTDVSNSNSDLSDFVFEVLKTYPNTKHRTKSTYIEEFEIVTAVARDGKELVMAGVRAYGNAVSGWPESERKFTLGLEKFMKTQEYLADPQKWERGTNAGQTSTAQRRVDNTRTNLTNAVRKRAAERTGFSGGEQQNRTDGEPEQRVSEAVRGTVAGGN